MFLLHALPQEMMEPHLTMQALGFGAGVVMSVLLLALLRRGAQGQPSDHTRYYQAATALMWNLGGLLDVMFGIFGFSHTSALSLGASILHFSGAAFFPPSFLAMWRRPHDDKSPQAKACFWLCGVAMIVAVVLTVWFVIALFTDSNPTWDHSPTIQLLGNLVAIHVAVMMALGALLLLRGRLNDFVSKFYAATTLLGASTPALMIVPAWLTRESPLLFLTVCFIKLQMPLLVLMGAIVFFANFRFSNVYVKSSLRFFTALTLALLFCVLLIKPLPLLILDTAKYPTAALAVAATSLLIGLMWLFVWINPRLNRLVDQWLFREPDYARAMQQVWDDINQATSAAEDEAEKIFQIVSRFVRETLELENVRVIAAEEIKAHHLDATLMSGEVCELSYTDQVKWQLGGDVEFLAPIRVKGKPTHLVAVAPGQQRRHLLDSEISFLRVVAGQVSSRLEALTFEKEKAERRNKEERLRRQVTEAELRALRAQINPHFLFNSLNMIADLIVTHPARAERMTVQLAKVFRHVLSNSDRQMITLGEELEFLRTYLEIETMRFGDRLHVNFDIDSTVAAETVPSLILQPVVENALKHGLAPKVGSGTLQISVRSESDFLRLAVEDDGIGFNAQTSTTQNGSNVVPPSTQKQNGTGVGLRNITERLATIYAGGARVLFEARQEGGSRVTLLIPRLSLNQP